MFPKGFKTQNSESIIGAFRIGHPFGKSKLSWSVAIRQRTSLQRFGGKPASTYKDSPTYSFTGKDIVDLPGGYYEV